MDSASTKECKEEINSLAIQYFHSKKAETMQKVQLDMWEIKDYIFSQKSVREFLMSDASGSYEDNHKFVEKSYQEAIPKLLSRYNPKYGSYSKSAQQTFLQFFASNFSKMLSGEKINALAIQYYHSKKTDLMQQIWFDMWEMKDHIFAQKSIYRFLKPDASGLYEGDHEFVEEQYQLAIPRLLNEYEPEHERHGKVERRSFLQFFITKFSQELSSKLSEIARNAPHDYAIVKVNQLSVYEQPDENSLIKNLSIKQGAKRRIISTAGPWARIELRNHGKYVYVRSCDVECHHESEWIEPIDDGIPAADPYWNRAEYSEEFDQYLILLLKLWTNMIKSNTRKSSSKLSYVDCYRMHFTGVLVSSLKRAYQGRVAADYWGISCGREKEIFDAVDVDLLDYLLEDICRNLNAIAVTNVHTYEDVGCTCKRGEEEIHVPPTDSIYKDFLAKCKGIGNGESVASRIASTWEKFQKQYDLFADNEYHNALENGGHYLKRPSIRHEAGCCFQ